MAAQGNSTDPTSRSWLAIGILIFAALAITSLAIVAILVDRTNTMTIMNMVLPVIASWVGTILAFYFGRENFESANQQVRALVDRLSPEERAQTVVTAIMRRAAEITCFQIPQGKSEQDVTLKDLNAKFNDTITRLPVVNTASKVLYMIHQSSINKYLVGGGSENDTLATFLAKEKANGIEYGPGKGFVVVPEKATLADAKSKMESVAGCEDIFITKSSSADEPMLGWISNVRLAKYMQV